MKSEIIFKGPALVYYLVEEIKRQYPENQIGKTVVQKIMYFLERELRKFGYDFDYTMYHYGPYSDRVSEYLNIADAISVVDIKWVSEKGYFITPKKKGNLKLEELLTDEEKKFIEKIVSKYGRFNAIKLSIIATAMYAKEKFGIKDDDELMKVILSIKPHNKKKWIKEILMKTGVINGIN